MSTCSGLMTSIATIVLSRMELFITFIFSIMPSKLRILELSILTPQVCGDKINQFTLLKLKKTVFKLQKYQSYINNFNN